MNSRPRLIFHVDVNSAFLSWESAWREEQKKEQTPPTEDVDLRTIASAIGGDPKSRHGIILAKSTKAKEYGITTGEPLVSALKKCPDLVIVPPNFKIYAQYSAQLMKLLSDYTPSIYQFSIDEAFLDMTETCHLFGDPIKVANDIRERVYKELHFTVNVGVSVNKLLAKMASDFKKPNLCHTLFPEEIETKMWPLPVDELFFVGRSALRKCNMLGIHTIGDLAKMNPAILKAHFGAKYAELILNYANGIDNDPVISDEGPNKGYGNSVTLKRDVTDFETASQVLLAISETVGSRLRMAGVKCNCITVEFKNADFITKTHQVTLPDATNTTNVIYEASCRLLKEIWNFEPIRLLGIRSSKLDDNDFTQLSLFDNPKNEKQKKLDMAIDSIRGKFGDNSIKRASFLSDDTICPHKVGK